MHVVIAIRQRKTETFIGNDVVGKTTRAVISGEHRLVT